MTTGVSQDTRHEILDAFNEPREGPARVEKEHADSLRVKQFSIDESGFTEMKTIG